MPIDARKCCRMTDGHPSVNDFDALECAAAEIRYGNLDEALVYLTRAIPALEGLPPPRGERTCPRRNREG